MVLVVTKTVTLEAWMYPREPETPYKELGAHFTHNLANKQPFLDYFTVPNQASIGNHLPQACLSLASHLLC